ncbi:MAG: hypothetical protein M3014_12575 [Chloroflexota bacterium]|nr:hypothetical protein [Chloroflexota bacterium]
MNGSSAINKENKAMWHNFYALGKMADNAQVDLRTEGLKRQRWAQARKSVKSAQKLQKAK